MISNNRRGSIRSLVVLASLPFLYGGTHPCYARTKPVAEPLAEIQTILIKTVPQTEATSISEVEVKRADTGVVEPGKVGMKLFTNDEIKTGEDAEVTIVFTRPDSDDRIDVMLKENARAKISSLFGYYGSFFISGLGIFDTRTNYVRLGKRGTEFEMFVAENGDVDLKVLRGEVDVERLEPPPVANIASHHFSGELNNAGQPFQVVKNLRVAKVETVQALHGVEIRKGQEFPPPRRLKTDEVEDILKWTDKLIIASFPAITPRNIIPTAFYYDSIPTNTAEVALTFQTARRRATLEPNAVNATHLGDVYKDLGDGTKSLVEYAEAVKVKPALSDSIAFLANQAEAYRLAGNLKKAEDNLKKASSKLTGEDDPQLAQLVYNASGNLAYDKAIQSIAGGDGRSARRFFNDSKTAYEAAAAKSITSSRLPEVLNYNLRNVRLAFGPDPTIVLPGPDLTGTYRGMVKFPGEGLYGDSMLVVTGNRFTLLGCNESLTGSVVTRKGEKNETFVDLMFDSIKGVKKLFLKALSFDHKRIALTSAPGEKNHFDFSTVSGQRLNVCLCPSKPVQRAR